MLLWPYPFKFSRSFLHQISPLFHRLYFFLLILKLYLVSNLILHSILGNDLTIDWIPQTKSQEIIFMSFNFTTHIQVVLRPYLTNISPILFFLYYPSSSLLTLCIILSYPASSPDLRNSPILQLILHTTDRFIILK